MERPGTDTYRGSTAVGTLIELLSVPQKPRKINPLHLALIKLLPQIKASDAALLTAKQRKMLYSILKDGLGGYISPALLLDFRLAILKALEQIGDADAIPIVEQLASGRTRTPSQKALQTAANECLPLLRAHLGNVEANKTLLRASSLAQTDDALLLRPTEFAPAAAPNTLLRPSEPEHK